MNKNRKRQRLYVIPPPNNHLLLPIQYNANSDLLLISSARHVLLSRGNGAEVINRNSQQNVLLVPRLPVKTESEQWTYQFTLQRQSLPGQALVHAFSFRVTSAHEMCSARAASSCLSGMATAAAWEAATRARTMAENCILDGL